MLYISQFTSGELLLRFAKPPSAFKILCRVTLDIYGWIVLILQFQLNT